MFSCIISVRVCEREKERERKGSLCYCAALGSAGVVQVVCLCAALLIASSVNVKRSNGPAIKIYLFICAPSDAGAGAACCNYCCTAKCANE